MEAENDVCVSLSREARYLMAVKDTITNLSAARRSSGMQTRLVAHVIVHKSMKIFKKSKFFSIFSITILFENVFDIYIILR